MTSKAIVVPTNENPWSTRKTAELANKCKLESVSIFPNPCEVLKETQLQEIGENARAGQQGRSALRVNVNLERRE